MDFVHIARETSPETADKLRSNDYLSTGAADLDGEQLDDLTRGAVILGVETIDYPLTDGLYIYLKRPAGDVIALFLDAAADCGTLKISGVTIA